MKTNLSGRNVSSRESKVVGSKSTTVLGQNVYLRSIHFVLVLLLWVVCLGNVV